MAPFSKVMCIEPIVIRETEMNTKELFKNISQTMRLDFEKSKQVKHAGSRGTVRENVLRAFLEEGRLPERYGIGSGEIVSRVRETSHQSDLIIYDRLNGVTLLYDEKTQVYPIDCVYGIVEVKSALSKTELLDSLEKIRTFKSMFTGGTISHTMGPLTAISARPRPFGMIFAYTLSGNSLKSLCENLKEWERTVPPSCWPNYICVLEAGIIQHNGKPFETLLDSDKIVDGSWPSWFEYKEESLFQFYSALHDICARMNLGPVELSYYYKPLERVGKFIVKGHVELDMKNFISGEVLKVRLTEAMLDRIVSWCQEKGPMTFKDALIKRVGSIPLGMDPKILNYEVFLYNPNNLPGLHELGPDAFTGSENTPMLQKPSLASLLELNIDGRNYQISLDGFTESDYEILS